MRKKRITSSKAHSVLTRQKNFASHVDTILSSKPKSELSKKHKDNLDHGIVNEPIARQKIPGCPQVQDKKERADTRNWSGYPTKFVLGCS